MCFTSLYHCVGEAIANLGIDIPESELSISKFDTRTRNTSYISPEQIQIGRDLIQHGLLHNGKIDEKSPDIQEFLCNSDNKITSQSDIYAIGAILFRLLFGIPPTHQVADSIDNYRMQQRSPEANVYEVPFFAMKRVISNELCQILIHLLHKNPKYRF